MYKVWLSIIALGVVSSAVAQTKSSSKAGLEEPGAVESPGVPAAGAAVPRDSDDPYAAYLGGNYESALAGIVRVPPPVSLPLVQTIEPAGSICRSPGPLMIPPAN